MRDVTQRSERDPAGVDVRRGEVCRDAREHSPADRGGGPAAAALPPGRMPPAIGGCNLAKIQILIRAADGHHSAALCQDLRAIPEVAHVVACELKHAWTVPRLPTHVPFEGKNKPKPGETPDAPP